ncbi:hypothetical protein KR018_012060, partial [Drosophila ironensis]
MVYSWMIWNKVPCLRKHMFILMSIARYLRCESLGESILKAFDNHRNYRDMYAIKAFWLAHQRHYYRISNMMISRVFKCFLILVGSREFFKLTLHHFCIILDSNFLAVQCEIESFHAALMWLHFNYTRRKKHIAIILGYIRYYWMPPVFISQMLPALSSRKLRLRNCLFYFVLAALVMHLEAFCDMDNSESLNWRRRAWIRDYSCIYSACLDAGCSEHIDFNLFVQYLQCIHYSPNTFLG